MSAARQELGGWAETLAAEHLKARGYRVLGRNVRTRGGELDVVAQDGATLVFVEVKAAESARRGSDPAQNVHALKRRRLERAARAYLARRGSAEPYCRFDVITLVRRPEPRLEHHIGAFTL